MNDISSDTEMNIICHCSGTTERQVKEIIDNKIDDLDSISRITGACSGCGGCEASIRELLEAI